MVNELLNGSLVVEFAKPWLWLLLPLPLLVFRYAPSYRAHSEFVQVATLETMAPKKERGVENEREAKRWPYVVLSIVWLGLVATAANPERIIVGEQREVSVRDILLVLDISGSMAIRDMQDEEGESSRMDVMKTAVVEFIEKREHDNIGLIVFGSQALPLAPVSHDHNALLEQINEMVPGMAGPQTSIGDAIGVAIRTYRQMNKASNSEDKERMMILLTDGLDTSSVLPPRVALRLAETQNVMIHSIAFGNVAEDGSEKDSSIDTQLLKDIAKQTRGSYHQASESLESLQNVYAAIDKLAPTKVKLVGMTERESLFTYPLSMSLLFALILLAVSFFKGRKHD